MTFNSRGFPLPLTRWRHHSGREYVVVTVTNQHSDNPQKFPVTVVYRDGQGRTWSRPVGQFLDKFTPL